MQTDLEKKITDGFKLLKNFESKNSPCYNNRASEIGHPCLRYLVYNRTHWNMKNLPSFDLQCIFDEGNLHEKDVFNTLQRLGLSLYGSQTTLLHKDLELSGHIDGYIQWEEQQIPLEIKSLSPINYDSVSCFDDLLNHKRYYMKKYAYQIQSYTMLTSAQSGIFVLKNKVNGQLKPIQCKRNQDICNSIHEKCLAINDWVTKNKTDAMILPDRIEDEGRVCDDCPFTHLCLPDIVRPANQVILDSELEDKITKYMDLKKVNDKYKALDDELKEKLREVKGICGKWSISGSWKEYKAQPEKITPAKEAHRSWIKKITEIGVK